MTLPLRSRRVDAWKGWDITTPVQPESLCKDSPWDKDSTSCSGDVALSSPCSTSKKGVCVARGILFQSKIDLMEQHIRTFTPVAGTRTHVLLASWYGAKRLWMAARARHFLMTTGLKANWSLRVLDAGEERGWRWSSLAFSAARLSEDAFTPLTGPRQGDASEPRTVYVLVVDTRVRSHYRCQVVIARPSLDAPASATRHGASSDVDATPTTLLDHIAAR